jgi:phospholipid-binding lipoprotein MlaA
MHKDIRRQALAVVILSIGLGACSTAPVVEGEPEEAVFPADRVLVGDETPVGSDISDPWEGFNRTMYRFNYHVDNWVLLPAVVGYKKITPNFVEKGVHNFFTNYTHITTIINSTLQFSGHKIWQSSSRFVVNTTVGLLGLFDPATAWKIPRHQEDFGQTLGKWGVGRGPYLVLPLLGPSSVRDGIGTGVDWYVLTKLIRDEYFGLSDTQALVWSVLQVIDTRAHVPFLYYQTGSPWEYDLVRTIWSTKREMDIER